MKLSNEVLKIDYLYLYLYIDNTSNGTIKKKYYKL